MIAAGVIDAFIAILKANPDNTGIQRHGIGCLANLARTDEAEKVRNVLGFTCFCSIFKTVCGFFLL
jgi:hypothetical protein